MIFIRYVNIMHILSKVITIEGIKEGTVDIMSTKHGNLSINSDNIFPIIKKWLYSDHDIFFRELISNGCDAITKIKKLDMMGSPPAVSQWAHRLDNRGRRGDCTASRSDR